jgi:hypothetical protein
MEKCRTEFKVNFEMIQSTIIKEPKRKMQECSFFHAVNNRNSEILRLV